MSLSTLVAYPRSSGRGHWAGPDRRVVHPSAGRLVRVPIEPRPDLRVGVLGPILIEGRSGALIEPPGALA